MGNKYAHQGCCSFKNVIRLLEARFLLEVPVYTGCSEG